MSLPYEETIKLIESRNDPIEKGLLKSLKDLQFVKLKEAYSRKTLIPLSEYNQIEKMLMKYRNSLSSEELYPIIKSIAEKNRIGFREAFDLWQHDLTQ